MKRLQTKVILHLRQTLYYGYKFHAVCTIDGVFTDFDFTQASIHDIHYLKNIKSMDEHGNSML